MSSSNSGDFKRTVYFRSLGCPKNQLDTEVMLGTLVENGYAIAETIDDADVAVINTCSFIESAREESVEAILEIADLREQGQLRGLVVTGCLPQRYGAELAKELPEVDAFVGTNAFPDIANILDDSLEGRGRGVYVETGKTHLYDDRTPRILLGARHTAYIKIAEGCDRVCTFCAIPGIRGKFQSRTLESVVAEAEQLAKAGVREINLIAQDSTSWGKDLDPRTDTERRPRLPELLSALDDVTGIDWIRLLYVYPSAVTDELLETLAGGKRLLPYIDIPLQHASDRILRAMRRGTTASRQRSLISRMRAAISGITLRTTCIVGFPGETDADFEELLLFVEESRFDRLGVFRYSDEDGTAATSLGGKVPRPIARDRYRRLTELQRTIMKEKLSAQVGQKRTVLVDATVGSNMQLGRLSSQAPEIDGIVFLHGEAAVGDMVDARITGSREVDLEAKLEPS